MFSPIIGAPQRVGVGGADRLSLLDPPRAVDVDRVVRVKRVPSVWPATKTTMREKILGIRQPAVVGHDAGGAVHGPQVESVLFDLEAVGVQLAASLQNLEVTVPLDVQVLQDEEHHLAKDLSAFSVHMNSPFPC